MNTKEAREKFKNALKKIDSGEELSKGETKELLFDAYALCERCISEENKAEYFESISRNQIRLFEGRRMTMREPHEFSDIRNRLKKYRSLLRTRIKDQREKFRIDMLKQYVDFFTYISLDDERGIIDSLCNMCIIIFNAKYELVLNNMAIPNENDNLMMCGLGDIHSLLLKIRKRGYSPYLCLLEKIKELETAITPRGANIDAKAYTFRQAKNKASIIRNSSCLCLEKEDKDSWYFTEECEVGTPETNRIWRVVRVKKLYRADYNSCRITKTKE